MLSNKHHCTRTELINHLISNFTESKWKSRLHIQERSLCTLLKEYKQCHTLYIYITFESRVRSVNLLQVLVAKSPIAPFAAFVYHIEQSGLVLEGRLISFIGVNADAWQTCSSYMHTCSLTQPPFAYKKQNAIFSTLGDLPESFIICGMTISIKLGGQGCEMMYIV